MTWASWSLALIFVSTGWAQVTQRVNVAMSGVQTDDTSSDVSISDDGRYVAFASYATNFVAGSDSPGTSALVSRRSSPFLQDAALADRSTLPDLRVSCAEA